MDTANFGPQMKTIWGLHTPIVRLLDVMLVVLGSLLAAQLRLSLHFQQPLR
jgi:hypothetical protein